MSATALRGPIPGEASTPRPALEQLRDDPTYQAFALPRIAFTVAPRGCHSQRTRARSGRSQVNGRVRWSLRLSSFATRSA